MKLSGAVIKAIQAHALEAWSEECCGVIKEGTYRRCRNIAPDPRQSFRICAREQKALWPFEAVVHSHPDWWACPSGADMVQQRAMGLPWVIVATDGKAVSPPLVFGDQVERPPLEGRGFVHGWTDCYGLIRDWYRSELGIVLPDFPRDWEWWLPAIKRDGRVVARPDIRAGVYRFVVCGQEYVFSPDGSGFPYRFLDFEIAAPDKLYEDGYKSAGFCDLNDQEELQRGDVILFQLPRYPAICHGGVYLGDGSFLHHLTSRHAVDPSRLSEQASLTRYQSYMVRRLRYCSRESM